MAGLAMAMTALVAPPAMGQEAKAYAVSGDAIPQSLTGERGEPTRGAALMADRHRSLCTLCHSGPFPEPHLLGTLAPNLAGVGARLTEGQIRLRVADMKRLMPNTIMPSYYRIADEQGRRVAAGWSGKPILTASDIEDIVAYLATLKG